MTKHDYRALCAELLGELQALRRAVSDEIGCPSPEPSVVQRARAALAQSESAPTDEDLEDLAEVMNVSGNPVPAMRRALELWGTPANNTRDHL